MTKQFCRFIIVGLVNTLFGYSVFAGLIYLDVHYALAAFFSTVLGVIFNYKTTGILVFGHQGNGKIVKFFIVYGILYLINIACLNLLTHFPIDLYVAGGILLIPLAILSFVLNKLFVFGVKKCE